MRKSLMVRLLATSVLIAVCSIAATAWLAATTTSHALRQEQGQVLARDAHVYDALLGYAATHRSWDAVAPAVASLAKRTGRRIVLTTPQRRTLADSAAADHAALPAAVSAVVNPLAVDSSLTGGTGATPIDPRAVGPYRLTAAERTALAASARSITGCLLKLGEPSQISYAPSGRPRVTTESLTAAAPVIPDVCGGQSRILTRPTPTEAAALHQLEGLVNPCLRRQGMSPIRIGLDYIGPQSIETLYAPMDAGRITEGCVEDGRREQLAPYVAPSALLFVTGVPGADTTGFALTGANAVRIVEVAALVLTVTVAAAVLMSTRLIRPLRTLTEAAQRPDQARNRVPVSTDDEIGSLAVAFNDLSARRERLEDQRKAMVRDVAHELRTPLSNIRGWLEAVEDGVAVADRPLTSRLLREALLLQHIIDDLRDVAADDAHTFRLHTERVRAAEVVEWVCAAHRDAARTARVALTWSAEGDPELTADALRLRQAVGNLLSNAVRHTPPGGSVEVRTSVRDRSVLIEVADTGSGISDEELPHVFDLFWRSEKSRSRLTGGSGLGLAIVRQLTEAHGGRVTVSSTLGAGSLFTLHLPSAAAPPLRRDPAGAAKDRRER
ncbi:sensor histidine kinase [Streptomyces sp. NPDC088197]|uniref:sensor histidine kinase n=1 Tax=Streptomyces sp. NPDC088197 TaxID=3365840 RepID=UPI0038177C79